jgi:hypothetical protein
VKNDRERLGPPPVEPLSDVSWQRVEKKLFAQLDCDAAVIEPPKPRRAWQPWAFAGGLALAAAAAVAFVALRPTSEGPAVASHDAGVAAPSRVVALDAPTEVSFGEATITVDAESAVTMHGSAATGVLIVLERGAAEFEVAPRHGRPAFQVQAGEVAVRVIGTRFKVSRSGDAARVDVSEGHVEVVARGRRVQVRAGESWSSNGDREAAVQDPATSPGGIAAAPFSRDEPDSTGSGATETERTSRSKRPRTSRGHETDQSRYERAAALEATDARAALTSYRSIARGKGAWAANALYASGRLAAELGDRDTARVALRGYLARFPKGPNVADARALLKSLGE